MDESALIARAQGGDEEAFLELYRAHAPRVFRLLWAMLRDRHMAEDATQDVFVKVHGRIAGFRGESRFSTWLYRIGINTGLDLRRKAMLRSWVPLFAMGMPEPRAPEPEGEKAGIPESLWALLSPQQRAVVELRVVQEWSVAETAAVMGVSEGTIKTQLHRALEKLRVALAVPSPLKGEGREGMNGKP